MVLLFVFGRDKYWACTLRYPKTGKVLTLHGTHPTIRGEVELTKLAIYVGFKQLKRPCDVKIYGKIDLDIDDERYGICTNAP